MLRNKLTPNDLEVLIYCHVCPIEHPRFEAPAVYDALTSFLKDDVIQHYEGEAKVFTTTDKGRAWVNAILSTPIPLPVWVDSHGEVILDD